MISDTLGYIYLQLNRLSDAEKIYVDFVDPDDEGIAPAAKYHYALVLANLGQCDKAQKLIDQITSNKKELLYFPTHERVLVTSRKPDRCPAVSMTLSYHE